MRNENNIQRLADLLIYNPGKFLSLVLSIVVVSSGVIYLKTHKSISAKSITANQLFHQWKGNTADPALTRKMISSLKQCPSLQKAYQGEVTQDLISIGKLDLAEGLDLKSVSQLKTEFPYEGMFSEISLLIEKNFFQKALELSVSLKIDLEKKEKKFTPLYAYNLIRLALLHAKVGNPVGEKSCFDELKYLSQENLSENLSVFLDQSFKSGEFSLNDFVEERPSF
jgi:hypothetical protein